MSQTAPLEAELERLILALTSGADGASAAELARVLAAGVRGESTRATADPGMQRLLTELGGKTAQVGPAAIHFGSGSTVGEITIGGDVAGQNIIKLTFQQPNTLYQVGGRPNPYLGLESFSYEHHAVFGGREEEVRLGLELLLENTDEPSVLFITGASGSGKSSFAKAGLVPALADAHARTGLQVKHADFRPSRHPLRRLIGAVAELCACTATDADLAQAIRDPASLCRFLAVRTPPNQVNVLLVDQLEEAYTQAEANERDALLDLISSIPHFQSTRTQVLVTIRADYLNSLFESPAVFPQFKRHSIELRAMLPASLARAILRPLEVQNKQLGETRSWQPALLDRLIADSASDASLLPLLQVTLQTIWDSGSLTLEHYGTLADALQAKAEAVFSFTDAGRGDERTPAEREAIITILLGLVAVSLDDDPRRDVRRTMAKAELIGSHPERARLIDELVSARLLSAAVEERPDGTRVETIDIIHEALLSKWDRLRQAIALQRTTLQRRERLRLAVQEWNQHSRSDVYLLDGVRLAEANALHDRADIALQETDARTLLNRSLAAASRKRRRAELLVGSVAGVILTIITVAAVAFYIQRDQAIGQANIARSRELAASSVTQQNIDPELSLLLATEAFRVTPTREAEDALRVVLSRSPARSVLKGHAGSVLSVQFSPDGHTLLTASNDGTARLWDTRGGEWLSELRGHAGEVRDAEFNQDGSLVATGSEDATARIWRTSSGELISILRGHSGQIYSVRFSPNGTSLVTSSLDGTARVWEVSSGQLIAELRGHSGGVTSAEFDPSGSAIVTASLDGTGRVWDTGSARELTELRGHGAAVVNAEFSPDGQRIVTASADGTARVWDAHTGATLQELRGHSSTVRYAVFDPTGNLVATAGVDGTARLWESATGKLVSILRGHSSQLTNIAFSPDGSLLATASLDHTARLWDSTSGALVRELRGHTREVSDLSFSPSGRLIATSGFDGTARIWSARAGDPVLELHGHVGDVYTAHYNPSGSLIITAGADSTARLWDASSGSAGPVLRGHRAAVTDAEFSPDGRRIVTSSLDATARIWEAVRLPGATDHRPLELRGHTGWLYGASFSRPDGSLIVTAGADGTARLWDSATGEQLRQLTGHSAAVTSAHFDLDGGKVVTSSEDLTTRIWSRATGQTLLELRGHSMSVRGAQFSPAGQTLVTVSQDATARLWDPVSGQAWPDVLTHSGAVYTGEFSPDGHLLVTASEDRTARVWQVSSKRVKLAAEVSGAARQVWGADFAPDGQELVTASGDGVARVYPAEMFLPADELLPLARQRLVRELTLEERQRFLHD